MKSDASGSLVLLQRTQAAPVAALGDVMRHIGDADTGEAGHIEGMTASPDVN